MVNYSRTTTPPRAVNVALSFSASSFDMFSLSTFGRDSTNFLACEWGQYMIQGRQAAAYLDESKVRDERLDLLDDLRLRRGVEGLELHVEDGLLLRLLLTSTLVHGDGAERSGRASAAASSAAAAGAAAAGAAAGIAIS
jgi:hypothetical protein